MLLRLELRLAGRNAGPKGAGGGLVNRLHVAGPSGRLESRSFADEES